MTSTHRKYNPMKTYTIMGATGQAGGVVASSRIAHGANVRAIVRNDAAAQAWQDQAITSPMTSLRSLPPCRSARLYCIHWRRPHGLPCSRHGMTPVSSAAMAAITAGFNNEHIGFSQLAHQIVRGAIPLATVPAGG